MILKYIFPVILIFFTLVIMFFALKSKKFFKALLLNAVLAYLACLLINLTTIYSGVRIPVNQYTVLGCTVFGTPAVVFFLLLNLIFI